MSVLAVGLVLAAVLCWPGRRVVVAAPVASGGLPLPRWRRRTSAVEDLEALARVADLLAMTLRSGATPVTAVSVVAGEAPPAWSAVLEEVRVQLIAGAPAAVVWQRHARERPALGALAGAWELSEDLGIALAPSMTTSAQVLRAQVQALRRLEASTSGARATMRMLTLLPVVGLLAGFAFGLTPWEVYGHSAMTMVSAIIGLGLTALGWVICRWVLARAVAPVVHT